MRLLLLLLSAIAAGCASSNRVFVAPALEEERARWDSAGAIHPAGAQVAFRVFLIGDAGAPQTDTADPLLQTLRHHAESAGENSATVFLGDNVYSDGLPPADDPGRPEAEARLQAQIDAVSDAAGRVVFLPGNHDWNHSRPGGLAQVARQEAFVEAALGPGTFLPSSGFPGPVTVDLTDDLRMLVLDTEWWLGQFARGEGQDEEAGAFFGNDADFLLVLAEAVQNASDRRLLVVAHHPIRSNGDRAGVVPPERHLFPLTGTWRNAYVPLPFLGSLILAIRRTRGEDPGDLAHPRYRALREALTEALSEHEAVVYAAGHDHSLQYFALPTGRNTIHQIVSGSGSYEEHAGFEDAGFVASRRGFFALTYYDDGSARFDAIVPADGSPAGDTLASAWIHEPGPVIDPTALEAEIAAFVVGDSATAPVAPHYAASGPLSRLIMGPGYRETWAEPVTAPVLNLAREAGGLRPVRLGGGRQTLSLRLEGADGRTYILRSIEKYPEDPMGLGFTSGPLHEMASEVTSGMHPFGALVAARLSEGAGLYHTAPRLVYVPSDPRLGRFRQSFGERLLMLEEHPDGSGAGRPHFGNAEELIGPAKLFRELDRDSDHRVDAEFYLRARLMDVLLGDWDRHRDQWRWASFEPGDLDPTLHGDAATDGRIYRPVARDRDWALNDRDGLAFGLARPFLPKLQGLQSKYINIDGLTQSGREQDRRFLAPLDRSDWERVASDLVSALPDDVLEHAVDALPRAAGEIDRDRILNALRSRRDGLGAAAMRFYGILARTLDVVGSHEPEAFTMEWTEDGDLRLMVREVSPGSSPGQAGTAGPLLWDRLVDADETSEVRIWARGGDDAFEIAGRRARGRMVVRILPGAGDDLLTDRSGGSGIKVYAHGPEGLIVSDSGAATRIDRTNRVPTSAFGYEPAGPRASRTPLLVAGYNADDGVRIGAGARLTNHGFMRRPYLRRHTFTASVATATGGLSGRYRGEYPDAVGRLDLGLDAHASSPRSTRNFFGLGDSELDADAPSAFYRVRLATAAFEPYAERRLPGEIRLYAGPTVSYASPEIDSTRFVAFAGLPARDLEGQTFVGAAAGVEIDAVDRALRPRLGARFDAGVRLLAGLAGGHRYGVSSTALTVYSTPTWWSDLTLAVRGGGKHIIGTFPFYDAATIGGSSTLRGHRSDRFAGRTAIFGGIEPRLALGRLSLPLISGDTGLLAFVDAGRVWSSAGGTGMRYGYGGGAFFVVSGLTAVTATYEASSEGSSVVLRLGFAL